MPELTSVPLSDSLSGASRVLLAGAGGGFDVYCGLPLYFALRDAGKEVVLGNLTFANPALLGIPGLAPGMFEVQANPDADTVYFPEKVLVNWLAGEGIDQSVFCFERQGVTTLESAYRLLVERYGIDAIVLVDGGTDSLMRGDEVGLGTPHEDVASIAAVYGIEDVSSYLVCLGFGVDAFHGVCHAHFLEAVADISKRGAFLGAFSLLPTMPGVSKYLRAIDDANRRTSIRPSIVNNSTASAIEGEYGDVHRTRRTRGSELWINPLMAMYWCFELPAVAERVLYLDELRKAETYEEIDETISTFRRSVMLRRPVSIPV